MPHAKSKAFAVVFFFAALLSTRTDGQELATRQLLRTSLGTCYEVDPDFLPVIENTVQNLRAQLKAQGQDKLIAYLSIPLSGRGGGYRPVNVEISEFIKARIEARFQNRVWVLAPGKAETELPKVKGKSAQGGEYMYMWTRVLAGENGYGEGFDLLFAAGPSEVKGFFGPPDEIPTSVERYVDLRAKTDSDFRDKIASNTEARKRFIAYYTTKASVAFSDGSHDEWNIFVEINQRRRNDPRRFGQGDQIPIFYDGRSVSPVEMETKVSTGYEKKCPTM